MSIPNRKYTISIPTDSATTASVLWFVADLLDQSDDLDPGEAPFAGEWAAVLLEAIRDTLDSPEELIAWWDVPENWKIAGRLAKEVATIIEKANAMSDQDQRRIRADARRKEKGGS